MSFLTNIILRIRAALAMLGVRHTIDWTVADQTALKLFLNGQTGQRFIQAVRNDALDATAKAVFAPIGELERAAGYAKGLQAAFAHVCRLSATDPLKVARHDGKTSLTENSEDLQPEEEAAEPFFWGSQSSLGSTIEQNE